MTSMNKLFEIFRNLNLKSDAVPRPPRQSKQKHTKQEDEEINENMDSTNAPEEILVESDDDNVEQEKKPRFKFFKPSKKEGKPRKDKHGNSNVNTQATGNVINIVNSKNVRWGNDYYMGPAYMAPSHKRFYNEEDDDDDEPQQEVKITNDIKLLLESKIKPEHEYLDHISKNLGRNWQKFFMKLGYSKNRIETFIIDTEKYGVSEARYKLLLDWIDNEDDPSLGRLATLLWEDGERVLIKELAIMYKRNIK